jgi:uncharacterized membrane protein
MANAIQNQKEVIMNTILKKIIWLVLIAPAIYLAAVWSRLPEKIAMQYDLSGNPTRYGNKTEVLGMVIIMTVMSILIYLFLPNIYKIDPKKHAAENKERLYRISFAVAVFISALQFLFIYSSIQGGMQLSMSLVFSGVGLLFAIIGNYMPNLKPNYFAGLRLPWTLENEENWRKTHLLAGKLWFAGGLLLAVTCLFAPPVISIIIFFTITVIIVLIPCIYSYRLYKKTKSNLP